jgi:flavorubredoxin
MTSNKYPAHQVSPHVYWVGAIDWNLRDFHGYATPRGTTYNAYLVMADTVTLIDTVKAPFRDEMLARIASVVDPQKIRCLVSNHAEMDHSGCLPWLIEHIRPEQVVASAMGVKALQDHFHWTHEITAVKDGETLSLGNLTLRFMETRMLHWPDSMFSYVEEERLLFAQDGFGMHVASNERFADEIDPAILEYEAAKYFANILMPFAPRIAKVLEKVQAAGLAFDVIAPDHGPIWRHDTQWIRDKYSTWISRRALNKAVIVFDSMWQSTEAMAAEIANGLNAGGVETKLMPLSTCHRSDIATEILDAGALLVGSPTLNDQMFPTVADVLSYLKGLKPQHLLGAAFGSYGWSGAGIDEVAAALQAMKVTTVADSLKIKYVPGVQDLEQCRQWGRAIAGQMTTRQ